MKSVSSDEGHPVRVSAASVAATFLYRRLAHYLRRRLGKAPLPRQEQDLSETASPAFCPSKRKVTRSPGNSPHQDGSLYYVGLKENAFDFR